MCSRDAAVKYDYMFHYFQMHIKGRLKQISQCDRILFLSCFWNSEHFFNAALCAGLCLQFETIMTNMTKLKTSEHVFTSWDDGQNTSMYQMFLVDTGVLYYIAMILKALPIQVRNATCISVEFGFAPDMVRFCTMTIPDSETACTVTNQHVYDSEHVQMQTCWMISFNWKQKTSSSEMHPNQASSWAFSLFFLYINRNNVHSVL